MNISYMYSRPMYSGKLGTFDLNSCVLVQCFESDQEPPEKILRLYGSGVMQKTFLSEYYFCECVFVCENANRCVPFENKGP